MPRKKKELIVDAPQGEVRADVAPALIPDAPSVPETHRTYLRRVWPVALWLLVLLTLSATLYLIPPEVIIAAIGVQNAYLLVFILSMVGGMMIFSGIPYHLVMISLALSGLNPYLLGLVAGIGVAIGDSTSYYAGYFGRTLLSVRMQHALTRLEQVRETHPRMLPLIFFGYASLVPFSSDVFTIPMGLIRYPFWKIILPLACGSIIFNMGIALFAVYGYDYLMMVF